MKTAKKKTAKAVKKGIPASRGPKAGGARVRLKLGRWYVGDLALFVREVPRPKGDK